MPTTLAQGAKNGLDKSVHSTENYLLVITIR